MAALSAWQRSPVRTPFRVRTHRCGELVQRGLLPAIAACWIWGFAFVGPLILSDWPGLAVAAGRYIAYGLASLLTLVLLWKRGRARLDERRIWRDALLLTLSGNLLYYALLSISVQKAGYVMPTLIIGLLPVTVSLAGRLREGRGFSLRYLWALVLILAGLWLAHTPKVDEVATADTLDEQLGIACAFGSLALWTMYGVMNGERLRRHPGVGGLQWSSLQGTAALPFALLLFAMATPSRPWARPDWGLFVAVGLFLGLATSWAANALWNRASGLLQASLLGQMIVFETIAGIVYGAVWSKALPAATVIIGTLVLVAGVIVALSERPQSTAIPASKPSNPS